MKKKYMIAFNIIETKEEPAYWKVTAEGEEGDEIQLVELKKGSYLKGSKKVDDRG
jgi:hypothetical protein